MRASIGEGGDKVKWSIDQPISPGLIMSIQRKLLENEDFWTGTTIEEIALSLYRNYDIKDLQVKVMDEDPRLISEISVLFRLKGDDGFFATGGAEKYNVLARLYLPVIFALVRIFKHKEVS